MDFNDIIKKHENDLRNSIPFQTAAEAAVKAFTNPAVHSMLLAQSRLASEAVASMIKSPDVQDMLASIAASTSFAAGKQLTDMVSENRFAFAAQMAKLVAEMPRPVFSDFAETFLKRQQERTEEIVARMTARSTFADDVFASLTRPRLPDYPTPLYLPPKPEPRETAAEEFMRRLKEHIEAAEEQIAESGGKLLVVCKVPGGDEVFVQQVSNKDEHFIRVLGIDQYNRVREFTGHHSSIGITVEVVIDDSEALESDDDAVN